MASESRTPYSQILWGGVGWYCKRAVRLCRRAKNPCFLVLSVAQALHKNLAVLCRRRDEPLGFKTLGDSVR